MTYTFEDFKREHSEEIVEQFRSNFVALNQTEGRTPEKHEAEDIVFFVRGAFTWDETAQKCEFWHSVAEGKYRKSVADESPKVPALENPQEKNMLKQKWQQLTMALGVWLIGGRETPSDKEWKESWEAMRVLRDEARKSSDEHYMALKKMTNDRDICERALKALNESATDDIAALELKCKKLSLQLEKLKAKTSSKKPKAKRVKK